MCNFEFLYDDCSVVLVLVGLQKSSAVFLPLILNPLTFAASLSASPSQPCLSKGSSNGPKTRNADVQMKDIDRCHSPPEPPTAPLFVTL